MADEKKPVSEENLTRDQWLERRHVGIGSSDAPVIVGVSPYKSRLQLYHEKRGKVMPHRGELEMLRWGNILERPIAQRFSEETGRQVEFLADPDKYTLLRRDFMNATLDGAIVSVVPADSSKPFPAEGKGVLEIKNASSYVGERWKDEPPIEFQVQVQHQLAVTGHRWGSIAALIGGCVFVWTDIMRDDTFIEKLRELERMFLDDVQAGREPVADGSDETKEFLRWLYPKDNGTSITLPPEWLDVESDLVKAKAQIKLWEGRKDELENRLKQAIGEATTAYLPNGSSYTFKHQTQKAHMRSAAEFRVLRHQATKLALPSRPELSLPETTEE